jgi:tRNA(Ile)-lysidine synthase
MFIEIAGVKKGSMLKRFEKIIDEKYLFLRQGKIYLAISGGKDSMTLSHLLTASNINHTLLHCNFQLRGKESDADEQFLINYANHNKLEIHTTQFNTEQIATENKQTIQECARELRYTWFKSFLEKDTQSYLLTAHHLDDSIETFFINLFRGTGYRGLAGIPPITGKIVRPLSDFTTDEIFRYLDEHQIEYRSDSSNAKKDYLRNKIRHDLIPELTTLEPEIRTKMATLFQDLNQLKAFVDEQVILFKKENQKKSENSVNYSLQQLKTTNSFMLEQIFNEYGIHRKNSAEFLKFLDSQTGSLFYTEKYEFLIDRSELAIQLKNENSSKIQYEIKTLPQSITLKSKTLEFSISESSEIIKSPEIQQLNFDLIQMPLTLRNWQQGDRMNPLGLNGSKLISDILTDKKIPTAKRHEQLVVVDQTNNILCLIGICISEDYKINPGVKGVLQLQLR